MDLLWSLFIKTTGDPFLAFAENCELTSSGFRIHLHLPQIAFIFQKHH